MVFMDKKNLLLYLEIPFCPVRCRHCVRAERAPALEYRQAYLEALRREVQASAGSMPDYEVQAVWVGGGIAGHMADGSLGELLRQLPRWFCLSKEAEITLKVHPGMVGAETLKACRLGGVNRLSVEYVTHNIFEHECLGRFLNPQAMDVTQMVLSDSKIARSFDLIVGLPGQTRTSLRESLEAALDYGAVHIALYPMELYENTKLWREWRQDPEILRRNLRKRLPDGPEKKALWEEAASFLEERGLQEYLPGQWAFPGSKCRYRELEAVKTECLAFGLGAVSTVEGVRSVNTRDMERYLRCSCEPEQIVCSIEPFMV